jgi:hypothetical protein
MLAPNYSVAMFRRAQVAALDLSADSEEIAQGLRLVKLALIRCQEEKVFQARPHILKMVNLHDFREAY